MDLEQHLLRQLAWSRATFGPGPRTKGVIDHIKKELEEIERGFGDPKEWVDVVILALDGLLRQLAHDRRDGLYDPEWIIAIACSLLKDKQAINEARDWPDWRTADRDKAIEHTR